MVKSIYVVDDEENILEIIEYNLNKNGYDVRCFKEGKTFLDFFNKKKPDLVILDLMLPDIDGFDICKDIKEKTDVPVIILSAKSEEFDKVLGLELGADDYLPKPCNPRELAARLRAILRRARGAAGNSRGAIKVGQVRIDPADRSATYARKDLELTSAEFNLVALLAANAGSVVDKDTLSQKGLGRALSAYDRSIDVHVSKIRKKFAALGGEDLIVSVRGVGYQLRSGGEG